MVYNLCKSCQTRQFLYTGWKNILCIKYWNSITKQRKGKYQNAKCWKLELNYRFPSLFSGVTFLANLRPRISKPLFPSFSRFLMAFWVCDWSKPLTSNREGRLYFISINLCFQCLLLWRSISWVENHISENLNGKLGLISKLE